MVEATQQTEEMRQQQAVRRVVDASADRIRDRPLTSVALATGVGLVLGMGVRAPLSRFMLGMAGRAVATRFGDLFENREH